MGALGSFFDDRGAQGVYSFNTGQSHNGPDFSALSKAAAESWASVQKALTTGNTIATPGTQGGGALRFQYLHNVLELVSFEQDDARLMKIIPKVKMSSTTIEWSTFNQYGGAGDGFVSETGTDGNFGLSGADDNFVRQFAQVKYMGVQRTVGLVASMVNNIIQPMSAAEKGATLELIAKMNLACYWGAATTSTNQFNGITEQILAWVRANTADQIIIYDAGGQPVDKSILQDIQINNHNVYGRGTLAMFSTTALGDVQKSLYPEARYGEGALQAAGINMREFRGTRGVINLDDDVMLRANRPLVADGVGSDGLPRVTGTADAGSLPFATTPFAACAAVAAGAGPYWVNTNLNTDSAILATAPAVPTPSGSGLGPGNNASNRLAAGSYYYGVSAVYQGRESACWVFGAAAAGTLTAATAVSPTAGQIVKIDIDLTGPCITGLGSTYPVNQVKFRVYRFPSTATSMSQGQYLMDIGCQTGGAGNTRGYDNGMYIPGSDNGFIITEKKNGMAAWGLMNLLPVMKRVLPHLAMADLFCLLYFGTPLLWVPRHHVWIRNIGRAN